MTLQYQPKYKPNQVICGTGKTVVVTGWTVKKVVANKLSEEQYAGIGNLYSPTRGISFLIRNLLLNPQVTNLVVLNATKEDANAGSCQCLRDFFKNGFKKGVSETGKECWIIDSEVTGYIDIDIPASVLEEVRENINTYYTDTVPNLVRLMNELSNDGVGYEDWSSPREFPLQESTPTTLPADIYGHRVTGKTIAETWVKLLHRIKTTGTIRPTGYDGFVQELVNIVAVVQDEPEDYYFPTPNYLPIDRDYLNGYFSQILDDAPYREGVKYTYGQRLRSWFGQDQVKQVINKLIGEVDAASAVMSLWDVEDHIKGGSPCLNHIWVRVIDGVMSMTCTFRSHDMFAGWVANAMGLRELQKHIRDEINANSNLNLKLGVLMTVSQSAHIYDDTWENAERLIETQYKKIINNRDYYDPSGNFLIEVVDKTITVNHTTPKSGEIVRTYNGKTPLKLIREISANCPAIQVEHIGYLGIELEKAYQCIKNNKTYIQDAIK